MMDFQDKLNKLCKEHGMSMVIAGYAKGDDSNMLLYMDSDEELERAEKAVKAMVLVAGKAKEDVDRRIVKKRAENWTPMEGNCPSRGDAGPVSDLFITEDDRDYWREDHTCTFCGSLDPEYVLDKMKNEGWSIRRTKPYKSYVYDGEGHQVWKFYHWHFTEEIMGAINALTKGCGCERGTYCEKCDPRPPKEKTDA